MPKLDDAFRDQLTPEEVAAFEAETEDDAATALESLANPDSAKDDEGARDEKVDPDDAARAAAGDDEEDDDPDAARAEEADAADKETAGKKPEADPEPKREPVQEPQIDPRAAQAALEQAKAKRKELRDAYNDGDLSDDEFEAEMEKVDDAVSTAQADLKTVARDAKVRENEWKQAGAAYLAKYPGLKAKGVIQALDKTVADLAQYPTLAALPHDQFLERVHKKLLADAEFTGLDIPAIEGAKAKKADPKAPEGDPSLGKPPKTLANTPASDVGTLDDSPYASLERLKDSDPIAFENAMAKMTPQQRDEFASLDI